MTPTAARRTWALVVVFAIAMAWVESACVYYLRVMVGRLEPYQPNPLPIAGVMGQVELAREAATLVMLLTVGALAGQTLRSRVAYTAIAFGVWDIFYYVFLKVIYDWPKSLLDWDILFLLPLPWWGPVLAPVSIALLMVIGGTLVTRGTDPVPDTLSTSKLWPLSFAGSALALYVFMSDSLEALIQGGEVTTVLPATFNWPAFVVALALMAAPLADIGRRMRFGRVGRESKERAVSAGEAAG